MKTIIWEEEWSQRVLTTQDTPTIVNKGDIVVMTIVHPWDPAADEIRQRRLQTPAVKKTDG